VQVWLDGDPAQVDPPPGRGQIRNGSWRHFDNRDVISMPHPWEYPWYAAWDLAFHHVTLAHRTGCSVPRVLPRRHRQGLGASHQTGWTSLVADLPLHQGP
jgi:hypothetical protein